MLKRPRCDRCQDGWIEVPDPVARRIYKNHTATALLRCDCRKTGTQAQGEKYWQHEKQLDPWKPPQIKRRPELKQ